MMNNYHVESSPLCIHNNIHTNTPPFFHKLSVCIKETALLTKQEYYPNIQECILLKNAISAVCNMAL